MIVGRVYDISKTRNALMQPLNQGRQPIRMRDRWSWLSDSRLRLENMRRCSLELLDDSKSN